MEGELEIFDAFGINLSNDLTSAQKVEKIVGWVLENFEPYSLHSHDFSEWDNEFELADELENEGLSVEDIIDEFFEDELTVKERKVVIAEINEHSFGDEIWVAPSDRVEVHPIEEELPDYDQLIAQIPSILRELEYIKNALPKLIGDNGAPGTECLNENYITSLQKNLREVESTPKEDIPKKKEIFGSLIKRARDFIRQFSQAFGDKTKIYREALLQSIAKEVGKTGAHELINYLSANGRFSNWIEAFNKLFQDWFNN